MNFSFVATYEHYNENYKTDKCTPLAILTQFQNVKRLAAKSTILPKRLFQALINEL